MMEPLIFLGITVLLVLIWALWSFRFKVKDMVSYFKTQTGKGAAKGILIVFAIVASFLLLSPKAESQEVKWFNYAEVYFGLDYTNKHSPFCFKNEWQGSGNIDEKTTSNLGFRLNILEAYNDRISLNSKYTHHSCAFNRDYLQYDTVFGFEGTFKFWVR